MREAAHPYPTKARDSLVSRSVETTLPVSEAISKERPGVGKDTAMKNKNSRWPCGSASSGSVRRCGEGRWRTCPSRRCSPPGRCRGSRCHRRTWFSRAKKQHKKGRGSGWVAGQHQRLRGESSTPGASSKGTQGVALLYLLRRFSVGNTTGMHAPVRGEEYDRGSQRRKKKSLGRILHEPRACLCPEQHGPFCLPGLVGERRLQFGSCSSCVLPLRS